MLSNEEIIPENYLTEYEFELFKLFQPRSLDLSLIRKYALNGIFESAHETELER